MPIIICRICGIDAQVARSSRETCGRKECSYALRSQRKAETLVKTEGVQKDCETCFKPFVDVTRRQTSKNCPICIKSNMVSTRRATGGYIQDEAQRLAKSASMKKRYEDGWDPNTAEHREKLSKLMKERWSSGKMRNKTHWTQTEEGRARVSNLRRGKKMGDESRMKMSLSAAKRVREGRLRNHRGRGGFREDLGFYVRSTWEANFARILKLQGKDFEYESESFTLSDGTTYTPDFKVDGIFYEIKGYMTDSARRKLDLFRHEHPAEIVQMIGAPEYNELYITYANLINWETT